MSTHIKSNSNINQAKFNKVFPRKSSTERKNSENNVSETKYFSARSQFTHSKPRHKNNPLFNKFSQDRTFIEKIKHEAKNYWLNTSYDTFPFNLEKKTSNLTISMGISEGIFNIHISLKNVFLINILFNDGNQSISIKNKKIPDTMEDKDVIMLICIALYGLNLINENILHKSAKMIIKRVKECIKERCFDTNLASSIDNRIRDSFELIACDISNKSQSHRSETPYQSVKSNTNNTNNTNKNANKKK